MKKIYKILLTALFLGTLVFPNLAVAEQVPTLYFFWARGCPFCEQQKVFLQELKKEYPALHVRDYSIPDPRNEQILKEMIDLHPGAERYFGSVPMTFFGDNFFIGFDSGVEQRIRSQVAFYYGEIAAVPELGDRTFDVPLIGVIGIENWSLGALAIIIGAIDGFNVCSLGALILILSLVLTFKSRKLTLILGGSFILVTVIVYGILMFIWHQLFLVFAPYLLLMRIIIGTMALLGGLYLARQFFRFWKKGPVCESRENKIIRIATSKLEAVFQKKKGILALLTAITLFALVITIVEFPCTAVFPLIFTGILAEANLSTMAALPYILIYLLFYMLDELAIFLVAVFTRNIWIASPKFMTVFSAIGAALLFFISYYYFFVL